jgi:hypothetical protein
LGLREGGLAVICWDRRAGQVIGYFTPRQIRWIRDHVSIFRDAVVIHGDWCALERHLADAQHITEIAQCDRHQMPYMASSSGVPAWSVGGHHDVETRLFRHILTDTDIVLGSLPIAGGVVVLDDARAVWAWIWSLYQCGMHLAFRLGLPWLPPTEMCVTGERAERSFFKVRAWLMTVIDTLIDVAVFPCPW